MPPDPDETYDNGPTYSNEDTEIWYDADGEQHVDVIIPCCSD